MRILGTVLASVATSVLLVACSGGADTIAGAVEDHLPEPSKTGSAEIDGSDPRGSTGVRATYGDEHVDVVVGPGRDERVADVCEEGFVECAVLDTDVAGATLTLAWQEEEPEEDPGIIVLLMERDDEFAAVRWGGDIVVTGDPRELDLAVPVDDAVDLLEDERVRYDAGPATSR